MEAARRRPRVWPALWRGQPGTDRTPNEAAERAIAAVLGRDPAELWAERYDETGARLSPQPFANYERLPPVRQRRKRSVELTGWR